MVGSIEGAAAVDLELQALVENERRRPRSRGGPGMIELAHRSNDGVEVTLWHPASDELLACVRDQQHGAYFEIRPERYSAPDVYCHPYACLGFSDAGQASYKRDFAPRSTRRSS
jgi:hypothetical protein